MRKFILAVLLTLGLSNNLFAAPYEPILNIINKVKQSIYKIYAIDRDRETVLALGSGVAITPRYIATNCHVAFSGNYIMVNAGDKPYLARICYFNKEQDLCIIDVPKLDLIPVHIRHSKLVKVGEEVFAIGNPEGVDKVITHGIIQSGITSGVTLEVLIKTNHGSSGGGLFDVDGNLIGITAGGTASRGITYALSTELILEVIDPRHHPTCILPE